MEPEQLAETSASMPNILTSPELCSPSIVSERDLDVLGCVLFGVPPQVLQTLNDTKLWWLPDLRALTPMQAVNSIRLALKSFSSYTLRVHCIASLYCCLAERELLSPWREFEVLPTAAASTGVFVLHELLRSAFQSKGNHTACAVVESNGTIYACVMATLGTTSLEHEVVCFRVIRSLPRLFLRVVRNESDVIGAIQSILHGDHTLAREGKLGDLRFAFATAKKPSLTTSPRGATSVPVNFASASKSPRLTRKSGSTAEQHGETTSSQEPSHRKWLTQPPSSLPHPADSRRQQ